MARHGKQKTQAVPPYGEAGQIVRLLRGELSSADAAERWGISEAEVAGAVESFLRGGGTDLARRSRSSYHQCLSENNFDIVTLFDNDGRIAYISPSVRPILGYTPAELSGKNAFDFVHPDDLAENRLSFEEMLAGPGTAIRIEYRIRHKDGAWRHMEAVSRNLLHDPAVGAIVVCSHDVTSRKNLIQSARESEACIGDAGPSAPIMTAHIGFDGRWQEVPPELCRLLGYTETEMLGMGTQDLVHPDDLDKCPQTTCRLTADNKKTWKTELRLHRRNDELLWLNLVCSTALNEEGQATHILAHIQDVTAKKLASRTLQKSERRFRKLIENGWDVIALVNRDWNVEYVTESFSQTLGHPESTIVGQHVLLLVHPEDHDAAHAAMTSLMKGPGAREEIELRLQHADGSWRWIEARGINLLDDPDIEAIVGTFRDVTDRRHAVKSLMRSEEKYRALVENINDVIFSLDTDGRFTYISPVIEQISGYREDEIIGEMFTTYIHPDDLPGLMQSLEKTMRGEFEPHECRALDRNGQVRHMRTSSRLAIEDGEVVGLTGVMVDITDQKKANEALRESEAKFRNIYHSAPVMIHSLDRDGLFCDVNDKWLAVTGYTREEILGRPILSLLPPLWGEEAQKVYIPRLWNDGAVHDAPCQFYCKDGSIIDVVMNCVLITDSRGCQTSLSVVRDVTKQRRVEADLRKSEERLELTVKSAELGLWDWDIQSGVVHFNKRWTQMIGYELDEIEHHLRAWERLVHPDDRDRVTQEMKKHLEGKTSFYETEHRLLSKSGEWIWVLDKGKVVEWDKEGRPLRATGTQLDITDRKQAEDERLKLETQILHAQKLESLGILAGGIAHDFNNLLVGILGNADLALTEPSGSPAGRDYLHNVIASAQRAADLCKQMLAYSGKGRFVVEPINLSEIVEDMAHLLEVSISKSATIAYRFRRDLPAIDADVTQIRQVIMNLITNASDAIGEKGGTITIETGVRVCEGSDLEEGFPNEQLPPGEYVCLQVADTGCGMKKDTVARLFDPFFSTKFTGRGLGMAAVLGIVRGHGGAIRVESQPDEGSTFTVLLPASVSQPVSPAGPVKHEASWRGEGTILIVDDEEPVRAFASKLLSRAGYSVLTATNGQEGVEVFQEHQDRIILVLLDMTMPKMNGEEAFLEMKRMRNDVRIILSSGYNEHDATHRFAGKGLSGFIQKPYRSSELMEIIRQVLIN